MQNFLELTKGLYDAEIIAIRKENLPYDYKLKNPIRNMFEIVLDAKQAMNDIFVKSIRFYNYKIVSGGEDIIHTWWYNDEIIEVDRVKKLKLTLRSEKNKFIEIIITFEKAEIVR